MKKYLFFAVAALAFAACAEKKLDNDASEQKGELEESYIAVTLKSADMDTRASDDFDYGSDKERYVKTAHFFLFNSDGSAFAINNAGNNYLSFDLNSNRTQPAEPTPEDPTQGPNVSDVKNKILVFNNYKGEYPTYMVAVLNWNESSPATSYTLKQLSDSYTTLKDADGNFVMSNSVYANMQGEVINATPITIENIGKTADEAKNNPVKIYVERVSAKVIVTAEGNVTGSDNTFDTNKDVEGADVYVKILGWDLHNDYQKSYLLKHIYPQTWGMADEIGFLWNDPNRFRSYWAASTIISFVDNNFNWDSIKLNPDGGEAYCGENTRPENADSDPRTKVVIKAQLVDAAGNPKEIAKWHGLEYAGNEEVRKEIAGLLSTMLYYKEGDAYKSIEVADMEFDGADNAPSGTDIKPYEAFLKLSADGLAKDWFTLESGEYQSATDDEVNAVLADVEPALIYKDGMTYYQTTIKHLNAAGVTAEYGVVRNHVYKVNVTDVSGFGTPVFDQDVDIDTPEHPVDESSYIAAEVLVLSWRIVEYDYSVK